MCSTLLCWLLGAVFWCDYKVESIILTLTLTLTITNEFTMTKSLVKLTTNAWQWAISFSRVKSILLPSSEQFQGKILEVLRRELNDNSKNEANSVRQNCCGDEVVRLYKGKE